MKYLQLSGIDIVNNALNFSTADLHVIGGCDIYTTKAAGSDKKLYRNIEESLESQYESLVRLSASLSPPCQNAGDDVRRTSNSVDRDDRRISNSTDKDGRRSSNSTDDDRRNSNSTNKDGRRNSNATGKNGRRNSNATDKDDPASRRKRSRTPQIPALDLSRASPFGPLSKVSSRRTFAYLIATLNASHPDYDFSHLLRPTDFRKERSLRSLAHNVDSTLYNLRPRQNHYLAPPMLSLSAPAANGFGNEGWGPRMWNLIDEEMGLRTCERYSYIPQDDPFDGEEGAIWSMHYFFFNREKKRVCYLYLRGLSVLSHSPIAQPIFVPNPSGVGLGREISVSVREGAGKRASYWLGAGFAAHKDLEAGGYEEEDDDDERLASEMVIDAPGDDEVEVPYMDLDEVRGRIGEGYYDYDAYEGDYDAREDFAGYEGWTSWDSEGPGRRGVRGISEEVEEMMEV